MAYLLAYLEKIDRRALPGPSARRDHGAVEDGLTLAELQARVGPRSGATAATIEAVLRDEIKRGRVVCVDGRYVLTGLDLETREALRRLHLPDDDDSRAAGRPRQPYRAGREATAWM